MITPKKQDYSHLQPPIDPEVVDLCDAINCIPGIEIDGSCSGHEKYPLSIFFKVTDCQMAMFFLARCKDRRYWWHGDSWRFNISVSDMKPKNGKYPVCYELRSTSIGQDAYKEAQDLVTNIIHHLNHKNFLDAFNIDIRDFDVDGEMDEDWKDTLDKINAKRIR